MEDTDELTRAQADGRAPYAVKRLYNADGSVGSHFLSHELYTFVESWETAMRDPRFAEIIDNELAIERIADEPLGHLAAQATSERARALFLAWLAFINVDLEPWTTGGSIHFRPHWARVLLLSQALADAEGLSDADACALACAAAFHDSRRDNPYLDTGHGARAARYYRDFCTDGAHGVPRATRAGAALRFDARVYLAIRWHDRDDAEGEQAIRSVFDADCSAELGDRSLAATVPAGAATTPVDLYRLFKDADALDRVRLGPHGLDERYLRSPHAGELVPFARDLITRTRARD